MLIRILGIALALFSTHAANAEEAHYYLGVDWGDFGYEVKNSSVQYGNANGLILRVGYDFNNWLAIEGHYSDPDDFEAQGSNNISGNGLGGYARMNLRFKRATLYAIAGGTRVNYTGGAEAGLGYGVGIDIYGSKDTALTFAYTNYFDDKVTGGSEVTVDAVTFGITHYFGNRPKLYKRY